MAINSTDIQAIWENEGLGEISSINAMSEGVMNSTFIINERYVLRLHLDNKRYATEAKIYQLLAKQGVLLPELIAVNTKQNILPYDYMITSRIAGQSIIKAWKALSEEAQNALASEAGKSLAYLHSISYPHFGTIEEGTEGKFASWYDCWQTDLARFFHEMDIHRELVGDFLDRLAKINERRKHLFEAVTQAVLLHSDYHFENLMQDEGKLTGIIDFEWAFAGDFAWDFAVDYHWQKYTPNSHLAIYSAYQAIRPIDDAAHQRIAVYRLLPMMQDAVYAYITGNMNGWEYSRNRIEESLTVLEHP